MNPLRFATALLLVTCLGAVLGIARMVAAAPAAAQTPTAAAAPRRAAAPSATLTRSMASREKALKAAAWLPKLASIEKEWSEIPAVRSGMVLPANS